MQNIIFVLKPLKTSFLEVPNIVKCFCRCFLSKNNAEESTQTLASPPDSIPQPHKHPVEDLDTKTEVILATAVAVLVVFIVTWYGCTLLV